MKLFSAILPTPLGNMHTLASEKGICMFDFPDRKNKEKIIARITKGRSITEGMNEHIALLKSELEAWFEGRTKTFSVPLHPIGTPFQLQVWESLLQIPFGETRSYLQQAINLGNAGAVRAVAAANGANGLAVLIPCHRVTGANGKLTGYSGGLERKEWLLGFEVSKLRG